MPDRGKIRVEVVFGMPERQVLVAVDIEPQASCAAAIRESGVAEGFPEFDFENCRIAIWGRPASRNDRVNQGDRVEILRPLAIDPRDARRQLATAGRYMGTARQDGKKAD